MGANRASSDVELLLPIARGGYGSLRLQLERQLREAVRTGRLAPGSALPSTRALARELGVSRGIVVEAYEQLGAEGYLKSRVGGTTRVASGTSTSEHRPSEPAAVSYAVDFRPGEPDLDEFPRGPWLHSVRRVLAETPGKRLGYVDGRGMPELRETLAAYLNRARATSADPANTLVCSGFAQGLRLVAEVLRASGARRVGMEDPSLAGSQSIVRTAGLDVVGIPVDADGLRVDILEATDVDAVVVTSAHQYPTGAVLPPERRAALLSWAARRGAYIVEDDYDAEFRYDRDPIGAMQGLCPECVVYAGSASKILAPGLRLGWLVAPASLVRELARAKADADMGSAALEQLAFADLIAHGELDRHLRRVRPIYRRRRDTLLAAVERHLPDIRPAGASAGLHFLAWLPAGLDEKAFIRSAADAGIGLSGVKPCRIASHGPGGIIFGYGSVRDSAIEGGAKRLGEVAKRLLEVSANA